MKFALTLILHTLLLFSCITSSAVTPLLIKSEDSSRSDDQFVAKGLKGMIATAHPLASDAAIRVLKEGGNAIDAAVTASLVISVVRPQSTGIGGGGFMLIKRMAAEEVDVLDFRERAPIAASRNMYLSKEGQPVSFTYKGVKIPDASVNGHLSVGVPGLIAGLFAAHSKGGKLPVQRLFEPAIAIAENGFPVYAELAEALTDRREVMKNFSSSTKIFFKNGAPLKVGDLLIQNDLAKTLRTIAEKGVDGFYRGKVAANIVATMKDGGGMITKKDLETYAVVERKPITGTYRGHRIVSMPPPSSGGVHIVQMLNMLEEDNLAKMGATSPEYLHLLAETMRRAFADRSEYLGDPAFSKVPTAGLTSKPYARSLRRSITDRKASLSTLIKPGNPPSGESPSTTHFSIVDQWGNAVASTQTVNYSFGSCVVAEGTGIILNDEMDDFAIKPGVPNVYGLLGSEANAIAAKKTMLSSMSPTMVFSETGKLELVVGSPGGPRIITATLQTIINMIDFKMPPLQAVHSGRIHHQWFPDEIRVEKNGIPKETLKTLEKWGHKINTGGDIGDVQAVFVNADQVLTGVSDSRSDGVPLGY